MVLGTALSAIGGSYTFTVIADTSGPYADFDLDPAINDFGDVVYLGLTDATSKWDVVIADEIAGSVVASTASGGGYSAFYDDPSLNNNAQVALYGYSSASGVGIFVTDGTTTTVIANIFGVFGGYDTYDAPSINDTGFVGFHGDPKSTFNGGVPGIYLGNGLTTTVIADKNDGFSVFYGKAATNSAGAVVFRASLTTGGGALLVGDGGVLTTIADSLGTLNGFADASINDSGLVALVAGLDAGGSGVFTGDGGALTTVATTDASDYASFNGQVALNSNGDLVFQASLDAGGVGLFTGADPVADKVIQQGDALLGSTVADLHIQVESINDFGQIVFWASLADGTKAIVRAEPDLGPTEIEVTIDIKPNSEPNCINNDGNGVIPIAILGTVDFDVTQIDAASVLLEGMGIRIAGKSNKLLSHISDSNGDGIDDLFCQIEDFDGALEEGAESATLTGMLLDGTPIIGTDSICIVPPE